MKRPSDGATERGEGQTSLDLWRALASDACAALRHEAEQVDPGDVAAVSRLRKHHEAGLVGAALDLALARRKARAKMPGVADRLIADPAGVEMATSSRVARFKASILSRAGLHGCGAAPESDPTMRRPVLDLCCGIGGDAIEIVAAGLEVTAIDMDPLRAWMAGRNAGCDTRAEDVTTLVLPEGCAVHIDPSRRDSRGKRFTRLDDMIPGPDAVRAILERAAVAAVKLAPGMEPTDLMPGQSHWISEDGRLTQAVLWRGVEVSHGAERLATMLDGEVAHTVTGSLGQAEMVAEAGAYVFTADPALERARLMHVVAARHGLRGLDNPGTGLLTGDRPVLDPWLTGYRVQARMAWNPRAVKRWLGEHDGGIIAVKTRAKAVDPDIVQAGLRGRGDVAFVVFVQRLGQRVEALITERGDNERRA